MVGPGRAETRGSWRRSRPFWGGLLVLVAGLELLSIPFATHALPLVIRSGAIGATYLISLVLVILGLMIWLQPDKRVFLGVVAVLISIASFVYANLGGFLIGMLLGLVGGALAVAWTPGETTAPGPATPEPPRPPAGEITITGRRVVSGAELEATRTRRPPSPPSSSSPSSPPAEGTADGPGTRALAVAVLPLVLLPLVLAAGIGTARAPSPATVATETAAVRADSLTMTGMKFTGVVEMPTATGTVRMLRFTMDKAVLERPTQTMGQATLTGSAFTFEGNVVICTTKMTARLLGLPQEFTAEHPNLLVNALRLVPSLNVPLTMTDIVSEQPYVTADSLRADGLRLVADA
ncbi:DUF6114 domain-containing protein [Microbispora sp. H11081]|uniref:DUF6114 domain-containing protein n=1 Tax=Microbispora sp. H11081 TaxID=2729107 RepID=UPI0020162030|nr:DUF6114 domain-containing protein [Microbispora sp. H11081]